MVCTFFGHRFLQNEIEPVLRATLADLIENHHVNLFYVGNQGAFDSLVYKVLKSLATEYPIVYRVVLAYMPTKQDRFDLTDYANSILPEGIEKVPKRFAISFRNQWMIQRSDYVVTYVTRTVGSGAAKFKELAQKRKKIVIEL